MADTGVGRNDLEVAERLFDPAQETCSVRPLRWNSISLLWLER